MASKVEIYKEVLTQCTESKLDETIVNYLAGILFSKFFKSLIYVTLLGLLEHEENDALNGRTVETLIGLFVLDACICTTQDELKEFCSCFATHVRQSLIAKNLLKCNNKNTFFDDVEISEAHPFSIKKFLVDAESGFVDPFLGVRKVDVNFNSGISLTESLKIEAERSAKRAKQLKLMKEWENSRAPLPAPSRRSGDRQLDSISDVLVDCFSISVGGHELLTDASLKIVMGRKYGLIGRNGIGKSTFISSLARQQIHGVPKDLSIGCVEQELSTSVLEKTALDAVLCIHVERDELLKKEKQLLEKKPYTDDIGKELGEVYSRLELIESGAVEAEAASLLFGLGFSVELQKTHVKNLSGGWRVRVALARGLFARPDILCLDEPTNHLDLHAVNWLTEFLISSPMTCIIVSHARTFLNDVCSDIIDFVDKKLNYYKGNYDMFEKVKIEASRLQQRQFEAQQMKREHVQKFIDRFRYKASLAASVQSRIKALAKLPHLEAVAEDASLFFKLPVPEELPTPILQLDGAWFAYDKENSRDDTKWILENVSFSVDLNSRIAICGVNGCGKSTFLKLLAGGAEPQKGFCKRLNKLRIGYFSQHHVEQLDLTLNSVQQLQTLYSSANLKDEDARSYLGKFGVSGLMALEPLYVLSGGQKSRVAIAVMCFTNPHILLLDEPTNHLDLNAVEALIVALNDYKGGIVIVSHDMHLLSCVVDDIYHVSSEKHTVTRYNGTIESYRRDLLKKNI
ncbi:uncharacterized protein LOC128883835 isoform X2 [Hylaeus volcanicus]|uniref:uncharacterized protein LOC128883835 isoform X2 n=1 Tax=Hylaeus volcanicus TaxID=313075 RepID=UPI0023B7F16D|nr:uncharacterized protein LOC128883835 isoform X2 [Hylaeus volcanicus]